MVFHTYSQTKIYQHHWSSWEKFLSHYYLVCWRLFYWLCFSWERGQIYLSCVCERIAMSQYDVAIEREIKFLQLRVSIMLVRRFSWKKKLEKMIGQTIMKLFHIQFNSIQFNKSLLSQEGNWLGGKKEHASNQDTVFFYYLMLGVGCSY